MKNKILEEFTLDELKQMVIDINGWNGELDYLDYQENNEEFFNIYFYNNPDEAVRAVCYGDYEYMDDYVRFNAYGNLDSCSEYEYDKDIEDYAEEIFDTFYRNIDNMWDKDLIKKAKNIIENNNKI